MDKIDQYTKVTADAFAAARDSAQAVYDDPQAAQEQVNTAYDVLLQAIFGLREIPDKSKLEELIKEAQGIDLAKYTEETAATFRTALAKAETVFENKNVSDTDVKEAEKMLRAAIDGLQEKKVDSQKPNAGQEENDKNTNNRRYNRSVGCCVDDNCFSNCYCNQCEKKEINKLFLSSGLDIDSALISRLFHFKSLQI